MTTYIWDVETTGLNPCVDRVLTIAIHDVDSEEGVSFFTNEDEKETLVSFLSYIKNGDTLIGFCSKSFDWQFIITRCLKHDIHYSKSINHIDIREKIYIFSKYIKGSLRDFAKLLDVEVKTQDGSNMNELYQKKDWDAIDEHVREDVNITTQLWLRCRSHGLV